MGFQVASIVAAFMLVASGIYNFSGTVDQGFSISTAAQQIAGIVLGLSGLVVFFLSMRKKLSPFNFFRIATGGVVAAIAARFAGHGILELTKNSTSIGGASGSVVGGVFLTAAAFGLVALYLYSMASKSGIRRNLENILSVPELTNKIVFTIGLLAIYRIGFHVPLPGVDQFKLQELAENSKGGTGAMDVALQYFSMFTGGQLTQSSLFALGIMPYITSSIIFMLLVNIYKPLEKLQKEGPAGQKKIQEYTRYATVVLCLIQSFVLLNVAFSAGYIYPEYSHGWDRFCITIFGMMGLTGGTMFLMWLGEQIDEYGLGNGISLLIMAGIVVRLPSAIGQLVAGLQGNNNGGSQIGPLAVVVLAASFIAVVAGSIVITQAQRRIKIQQAKQTRGRKIYGGQSHYMPLRVNHGGVMPIIFASSLMIFPGLIAGWVADTWSNAGTRMVADSLQTGTFTHTILSIALIYFFAYFWTTVNFRPKQMADQLRDMGHFIPGLRPGKRTSDYLERVMERITYCGAGFLALIAVIPSVLSTHMGIPFQITTFLGGTGLLIMVSVVLDMVQRIESNLVMRNYGGFLSDGTKIKGAN